MAIDTSSCTSRGVLRRWTSDVPAPAPRAAERSESLDDSSAFSSLTGLGDGHLRARRPRASGQTTAAVGRRRTAVVLSTIHPTGQPQAAEMNVDCARLGKSSGRRDSRPSAGVGSRKGTVRFGSLSSPVSRDALTRQRGSVECVELHTTTNISPPLVAAFSCERVPKGGMKLAGGAFPLRDVLTSLQSVGRARHCSQRKTNPLMEQHVALSAGNAQAALCAAGCRTTTQSQHGTGA